MRNKKTMPRTALRYAIEKMPEEKRKKAMER
jgi:3-methyladenine DNA glycosylase AlkD